MFLIYFNISLIFFYGSLFCMFLMFFFLDMGFSVFIELVVFSFNSMNFSLLFYFDFKSFMFLMVVFFISSMIVLYSFDYMYFDKNKFRFIYLLLMFVLSMLFFIVGQNLFMILLGWDGLGLVSYCLVVYYNSWNSYNSGMITLLTNRLGDAGLLLSIGLISFVGDWNYLFIDFSSYLFILFILLACFTKSAQFPFSFWLPMAMAAPTPISALVHSSTLVTAGIYLIIRLMNFIFFDLILLKFILFVGLFTMFFSGLVALYEFDFKKVVALSTLSQLGLMMISLGLGLKLIGFFHLVIHAMFKSMLFMCVGMMIYNMSDNQDIRFIGNMGHNYFLSIVFFSCSLFSLCGFPFFSGFYSKDFIFEVIFYMGLNFYLFFMFCFSFFITLFYSFRLIYYVVLSYMKYFSYFSFVDFFLVDFSMAFMFFFSIFGGSILNWVLFSSINFCYVWGFMSIFSFFVFGVFFFFINLFFIFDYCFFFSFKFLSFFVSLFYLGYFSKFYSKSVVFFSGYLYFISDSGWLSWFGSSLLNWFFFKVFLMNLFNYMFFYKILVLFVLYLMIFFK